MFSLMFYKYIGINMYFVEKINLSNLPNFSKNKSYLAIVKRKVPNGSNIFFKKLILEPFSISGQVFKKSSLNDIQNILDEKISTELKDDIFYSHWVKDMRKISTIFCDIMGSESISFSLGTSRSCTRYHIDNVPMRLLITYFGQGSEWLPRSAANYKAYFKGKKNEKIIKDTTERKFIDTWDIATFRGGTKGILHRTPESALKSPSLQMRLDHSTFLKDIEEYNMYAR